MTEPTEDDGLPGAEFRRKVAADLAKSVTPKSREAEAFLRAGGTVTLGEWLMLTEAERQTFTRVGCVLEQERLTGLGLVLLKAIHWRPSPVQPTDLEAALQRAGEVANAEGRAP